MKKRLLFLGVFALVLCAILLIQNFDKIFSEPNVSSEPTQSLPSEPQSSEEAVSSDISLPPAEFNIPEYSSLFCYSQLTEPQKVIYNKMAQEAINMTVGSFGIGECSVSDMVKAFAALRADLPEIFWLSGDYSYTESLFGVSVTFQSPDGKTKYLCSKEERDDMQRKLYAEVEKILKDIPADATDYEKELYIYDYICSSVKYDQDGDHPLSAYGALVEKHAICEGYSRAVQLLLRQCGIDSTLVAGTADNVGHMWNLVKIENVWYYLDATWGDAQGAEETTAHGFFNLNDEMISKTHSFDRIFSEMTEDELRSGTAWNFELPECNSLQAFYPVVENCLLNDEIEASVQRIQEVLLKASEKKAQTAEFYIDSEEVDIVTKYGLNHCISEVNKKATNKIKIPSVTYVCNSAVLSIKYEGEVK